MGTELGTFPMTGVGVELEVESPPPPQATRNKDAAIATADVF
jgi:hypothetical protein